MKRRSLLALLVASVSTGLSGCTGVVNVIRGDNRTKVATIERVDAVPSEYDLNVDVDVDVELERETITSDHTALLRFTVENTGDEPVRVGDGHNRIYSGVVSAGDASEPGLLLIPPEEDVRKDPRCWKPALSYAVPSALGYESLDAGETATMTYECWGQSDNSAPDCLPVGDYRFDTTYHVQPGGKPLDSDDEETFEWGFTLSIARADADSEN